MKLNENNNYCIKDILKTIKSMTFSQNDEILYTTECASTTSNEQSNHFLCKLMNIHRKQWASRSRRDKSHNNENQ